MSANATRNPRIPASFVTAPNLINAMIWGAIFDMWTEEMEQEEFEPRAVAEQSARLEVARVPSSTV